MRSLTAFLMILTPVFAFAQSNSTESLTITTYYPSPYGVYGILKLNPRPKPATCHEGEMTYDSAAPRGLYFCNSTNQWAQIGGGGGVSDPLVIGRVVIGDVNGDGSINAADIPAMSRPLFVQAASGFIHTAAFVNANSYGIGVGAQDGQAYGAIQSTRFQNGVGASPATADLVINLDGGNVGIGATNPTQKLVVNGRINATDVCTTAGKCLSAGGGSYSASACFTVTSSPKPWGCGVGCPSGTYATGGGATSGGGMQDVISYPSGNTGWSGAVISGQGTPMVTCYVRCCP